MCLAAVSTRMTAAEFFEWGQRSENRDRHFELEEGEVVEMSRPGERHGGVCGNVAGRLWVYTNQRRQGFIYTNDTGILLGPDTVRGPDVILYTSKRRFDDLKVPFAEVPPDVAVEVLPLQFRWGETIKRIGRFLELGIKRVWLLDPEGESLSVYRQGQFPPVLHNSDELTDAEVLPDFKCKVSDIFDLPREQTATVTS